MARSTFDGPVLQGNNKFGPLRNVGYTDLVQYCDLDFTNTTNGTYPYGGGSGQFVNSNNLPNQNATVYQPSATVYPPVAQTIPADTATNVYRGCVMYLPYGSNLDDVFVDVGIVPAVSGGSAAISSTTVYISNNYTAAGGTARYYKTGAISSVGRQALSTFTYQQLYNHGQTSGDITNPPSANGGGQNTDPYGSLLSQVVFTVAIVGTNLDTRTATATIAGAAISDTAGTFTCTSNAFLAVGQTVTISGTLGGTGSISGYSNPTSYLVATATGGAGTITGFSLVNLDGSAITTTTGTPTGLTYTISSALSGRFYMTARYTQLDGNIGSQTVYPYGNFD
jgi:hypothetical protein